MSWSSSQDDDGLEGLSTGSQVTPAQRPSAAGAPPKKKTAEATLVLKQRRMDHLRAEVRKKQFAWRRQRYLTILLWGVLGAGSVIGGALLAEKLTGSEDADTDAGDPASEGRASAPAQMGKAAAQSAEDSSPATKAAQASQRVSAQAPPAGAAAASSAQERKGSAVQAKTQGSPRTLSLDELPTE